MGGAVIKRWSSILLSILYYIAVFAIAAIAAIHTGWQLLFVVGFPALVVAYFVVAGRQFHRKLGLGYATLWLWMNVAGWLCCVIAVTVIYPHLWMNMAILFLMLPTGIMFLVLWGVAGLCYLIARRRARHPVSALDTIVLSKENTPRTDRAELRGGLRTCAKILGVLVAVFALAGIIVGVRGYFTLPPGDIYNDAGISTFTPARMYPTQQEYRIRRGQRSTRTVYNVEYDSLDGKYRYRLETYVETEAQEILRQGEDIRRRVLVNAETELYITIPPEETAESYVNRYRFRYIALFTASLLYLLALCGFYLYKKKVNHHISQE